jgi:acetyl-CoA acetyltransferase
MTVHVLGAAMTRFGPAPDRGVRSLAVAATEAALQDASVEPGDVEFVAFGNAAWGENACASSSTAFHVAWAAIASGSADVAIAIGAEKLTRPDKARTFAMFGTADGSPLMDLYAAKARDYMARCGATVEDFARVAVKNRGHAAANRQAQYRKPITVEEVLASRLIVDPLRLLMCAPVGDGAAAVVLCSDEWARRPSRPRPAVTVAASMLRSTRGEPGAPGTVARAAQAAYEAAGIGPLDIDVAEVHDAAAPAELMLYEELALCAPGDGPKLLAAGDTALGGRVPVNPSGGLLSKGHPVGATGCGQIVELVDQLRGRTGPRQVPGADIALAQNGGGLLAGEEAACAVTILRRR